MRSFCNLSSDEFSLFAVTFILPRTVHRDKLVEMVVFHVIEMLVNLFPTKVKLIIHPLSVKSRTGPHENLVDVCASFKDDGFLTSMLEIFTRRWQTMDLTSMMRELKRSLGKKKMDHIREHGIEWRYRHFREREDTTVIISIKENLSCLARLKMHEEPTF